jgi:hypothetical protein
LLSFELKPGEAQVRREVAGIQAQRRLERGNGAVRVSLFGENVPEVVVPTKLRGEGDRVAVAGVGCRRQVVRVVDHPQRAVQLGFSRGAAGFVLQRGASRADLLAHRGFGGGQVGVGDRHGDREPQHDRRGRHGVFASSLWRNVW